MGRTARFAAAAFDESSSNGRSDIPLGDLLMMYSNYWKWCLAGIAALSLPLQAQSAPTKHQKKKQVAAAAGKPAKVVRAQKATGHVQTKHIAASQPRAHLRTYSPTRQQSVSRTAFTSGTNQRRAVQNWNGAHQTRAAVRNSTIENRYTQSRYIQNHYTRNRYSYNNYPRPPYDIYRHWDHDRVHWWNDHRYHWYDGAWVVIGLDAPSVAYAPAYGHSSGSLVGDVQAALADRGYNPGPIDGIMGSGTRLAIVDFQSDRGLRVTGRIDGGLLRALGLG